MASTGYYLCRPQWLLTWIKGAQKTALRLDRVTAGMNAAARSAVCRVDTLIYVNARFAVALQSDWRAPRRKVA